jgi:NADH/F420H2 dehydrogenase subunit C
MTINDTARHDALVADLKARFGDRVIDVDRAWDDCAVTVDKSVVHDVLVFLKDERRFNMLMDVVGIDCMNLARQRERFELSYVLYSVPDNLRVRIETPVSELDMDVPTATDLWKSANWGEREAYEMFGFNFVGHPCLKRLLTHHEFVGHPLRKDYPLMGGQWCTTTDDMTPELEEPR